MTQILPCTWFAPGNILNFRYNILDNRVEIVLKDKNYLWPILYRLKTRYLYSQLIDIRTVHNPHSEKPFKMIYILLSTQTNIRIKVILYRTKKCRRVVSLYPRADWIEREIWDMFGIIFVQKNNKKRRKNRLLTDYGFKGHPLLKDFPESGMNEVIYDERSKRVITVSTSISINTKAK